MQGVKRSDKVPGYLEVLLTDGTSFYFRECDLSELIEMLSEFRSEQEFKKNREERPYVNSQR